MCLLVITLTNDRTLQEVTKYIDKPVVRLNIDDIPFPKLSYEWNGNKFRHSLDNLDLDSVTSVWFRIANLFYTKEKAGSYEMLNRACREEMVFQLYGLLEKARWVSDPYRIKRADNKQLQLETARCLGMTIPRTLVTSSPEEAVRFRSDVGKIVVKPVAKQVLINDEGKLLAIFTNRIGLEDPVDFSLLPISPAIFQEEIERVFDIRTIVVGDRVFSISITQVGRKTNDVDYRDGRKGELIYNRINLPTELESKCVAFVRDFGLKFSAMDFILGTDGIYYFLENNPTGSWIFVQNGGGHPIAQEIAKLLS